jgi:hypothetical protein
MKQGEEETKRMKGEIMKRIIGIIFLIALLFPVSGHTAGPCGDYEYAELQDMNQQLFIKEYCNARKTGKLYAELSMSSRSRQVQSDFDSCHELLKKMERIYMKRFKIGTWQEMAAECK